MDVPHPPPTSTPTPTPTPTHPPGPPHVDGPLFLPRSPLPPPHLHLHLHAPPLFLLRGLPLHEGTAQLRTPSSVHGRRPEAQTSIGPKGDSNSRSIPYAIMPTVPPATAASRDPFPPPNLRDDLLPVSSTLVYLTA
ncbi:hypothetical protein CCUS01_15871 [Colletotrichum cuscutae]|uniref:Uncharacterized protein n=1 Tax=Colletotrichum cuscutae TaxID=1209917 RepID=A0AAI9VC93_9PEZI|nr:hypothetical protein CCUS01_15871 [Colletotrichum cuscutae]